MSGFWNKKNAGRNPFADKDLLLKNGTPFRITRADVRPSNREDYGPQVVLTCVALFDQTPITDDMSVIEGAEFAIGLPYNPAREEMAEALNEALHDGEIIEAMLSSFTAKNGVETFDIKPFVNPDEPAF